ncbi:hypothetical protein E6O75_ATG07701 [Venturia nashicola]|uniref:Protein PNS1 n=1 Tax=Venturia nashicola TaxID=86259 RepID=A0A4Z1NWG4_9PEZI|nr:hypothetical protein E6O75_ATG07701 [Venturia nashicola]
MFSEYASRFLAQSQSRFSLNPADDQSNSPTDRKQRRDNSRLGSRSYLQRQPMADPYQRSGSQMSRFPFASRGQTNPAPLFFSATDEFREEDDAEEREREVADYYALQKSRRHFGASRLSESSEVDDEANSGTDEEHRDNALSRHYTTSRGIRSSWKGERAPKRGRPAIVEESVSERPEREASSAGSESTPSSQGKGKLVDVELSSSERSSMDQVDAEDFADQEHEEDSPPPFQQFQNRSTSGISKQHLYNPYETDDETAQLNPRSPSPDRESVPPGVSEEAIEPPKIDLKHDPFWASFFWICLASLFATSLLVYLNTEEPSKKKPLGDTVYTVLHKSFHLLAVDTLVAVIVAAIWLALLRNFLRPLAYLMFIAVPIILLSFSLYPLISSYKGYWHGTRFQDKAMRVLSFVPLAGAFMWCYLAYKARFSIGKAVAILDFASSVLTQTPALLFAGFVTLAATVTWFWVWLLLFTRVFLEGHWSSGKKSLYVIDVSTWWLGVFYALMLLWTQSVISGIQRATSAATTSQWYFHRNSQPTPSSRTVVSMSFQHATGPLFGSICLSTFLTVAVRLPLLLLPRRFIVPFSWLFYALVPSPIASLTNPLTLTYAAIHSQPLTTSATNLSKMSFVSPIETSTTLGPYSVNAPSADTLVQYRTAKLILHSTRYMMTLALGFGGWVSTARMLHLVDSYSGSLYAYIVGLGAAAIGWGVLGAMEGIILGIVDALVVCWGSEVAADRGGDRRYCREAEELFLSKPVRLHGEYV